MIRDRAWTWTGLGIGVAAVAGCASIDGPMDRSYRQAESIPAIGVATPDDRAGSHLIDTETGPVLQIMVCLGGAYGTHTGVRLIHSDGRVVFWDPAGHFGLSDPDVRRRRDVIVEGFPTLGEYVKWRLVGAGDQSVAVFEWHLDPDQVSRFDGVLHGDADRTPGGVAFDTTAIGLFCCKAVCEFIERFAGPEITVPERFFRPDQLGRHLWTQHPDRVLMFRADGTIDVWKPDESATPDADL